MKESFRQNEITTDFRVGRDDVVPSPNERKQARAGCELEVKDLLSKLDQLQKSAASDSDPFQQRSVLYAGIMDLYDAVRAKGRAPNRMG